MVSYLGEFVSGKNNAFCFKHCFPFSGNLKTILFVGLPDITNASIISPSLTRSSCTNLLCYFELYIFFLIFVVVVHKRPKRQVTINCLKMVPTTTEIRKTLQSKRRFPLELWLTSEGKYTTNQASLITVISWLITLFISVTWLSTLVIIVAIQLHWIISTIQSKPDHSSWTMLVKINKLLSASNQVYGCVLLLLELTAVWQHRSRIIFS